jgi:hypothetical protein
MFSFVKQNGNNIKYWKGPAKVVSSKARVFRSSPKKFGPDRALSQKDEFLLTLMKLRLGSTNVDLGQRFGITAASVSNIFATWVKVLSSQLRCLIYNPPCEIVKQTLPKKFNKPGYSDTCHIIDCTEIFIEIPSDPALKAATWSDYKHHHTAKILVLISPCRAFNFLSSSWGGRTSDVHITKECGFCNDLCNTNIFLY